MTIRISFVAVLALLATSACEKKTNEVPPESRKAVEADNTGKNERDRSTETLTPLDQGNNEVDLKITQQIRQDLIDRNDLSVSAKNVKVITRDRNVTLRGPVLSNAERETVVGIARRAGAARIDNQLEITTD